MKSGSRFWVCATLVMVLLPLGAGCRSSTTSTVWLSTDRRAADLADTFATAVAERDRPGYLRLLLQAKHCRGKDLAPQDRPHCLKIAREARARVDSIDPATVSREFDQAYLVLLMPWPSEGGIPRRVGQRIQRLPRDAMRKRVSETTIFVVRIGAQHYVVDARRLRTFGRIGLPE